jgi:hypothetical protein
MSFDQEFETFITQDQYTFEFDNFDDKSVTNSFHFAIFNISQLSAVVQIHALDFMITKKLIIKIIRKFFKFIQLLFTIIKINNINYLKIYNF